MRSPSMCRGGMYGEKMLSMELLFRRRKGRPRGRFMYDVREDVKMVDG